MANVQISEKLFFDLFRYHCLPHEVFSEKDLAVLEERIRKEIEKMSYEEVHQLLVDAMQA